MLNKIIKASLSNRVTVLIVTGIMLLWGCYTVMNTDIDIFPDLNAPTVVVMTEAPGYAPEEIEKTVTYPIETALNGAAGVRRVRSSSATGFSVVWIEFDWDEDVYRARQTVSEKLSEIASDLPTGVGAPTLGPQSSILGEIMIIGITADSTSLTDLRTIADRTLRPRILSLGGVSQVSVIGGDELEYQILLSPDKMKFYEVTLDEIRAAASEMNSNSSGGVIYDYGNEYLIKGDVSTQSVDDLAKAVIKSDGSRIVTLADVATVRTGAKTPRLGVASEKGNPAVLLTVTKQPNTGTIELTEEINKTLAQETQSLPADVHISTDIFNQADFINSSISNLQVSLFEGALFVIVVLFFFLMNVRTTLISLVALPLSVIVTVIILHLMGFSINTMSLGGIAIAIGSLVDDAIVDVENVHKRLRINSSLPAQERKSVISVVFDASREVRLPILNSSLIIIASFMPLFFLSGIEGRMLKPLGISFIVALAASTVVALTVTPVLCSYLLKGSNNNELSKEPLVARKLKNGYSKALQWCICHKKGIIASTITLFVMALATFFTLGRSFLPPFNEGSLTINVSTLPGISLEESDRIGRLAENIILTMPEVNTVARKTGRAELDEHSLGVNVSEIEAPYTLKDRSREEFVRELRGKLAEIPGCNIEIGQPISHRIDAMLSGTEAQIAIKIYGDDLNRLHTLGTKIKKSIEEIPGIVDVNVEQQTGRPQIDIRPRREMLARYGISNSAFNSFVSTMLAGETVSQVYVKGLPYDLTLKIDDSDRSSIDNLKNICIDSPSGPIPLGSVADIVSTTGPNTINRENVSRRLVVSANVDERDLRGAVNDIKKAIDQNIILPEGYHISYGGQFESEAAASRTLAIASAGALIIILLLLYQEYHNMRYALIILVNMPLAMIGGIFMLRFTSGELNIPAIIGFISLLGISTRNGMLLMSRYIHLRSEGRSVAETITDGSADRLNPIIMTALTSALALIPLALRGGEPGNEIQSPLAIVILGGLLTSTILNIFVVPIIYSLCENKTKQ
ncbi:MAG: CusA/CzcA family heavy metal efflux RND transporter [Paramuribaculum sp.]|nr:CusA/CzcA family heavy metal efflux RND transporter [Paramuribaculum sp.]